MTLLNVCTAIGMIVLIILAICIIGVIVLAVRDAYIHLTTCQKCQ
jgi:hypothetical protein